MNAGFVGQSRFTEMHLVINQSWQDPFPFRFDYFTGGWNLQVGANGLNTPVTDQNIFVGSGAFIDQGSPGNK
jgi:hypothetical protein